MSQPIYYLTGMGGTLHTGLGKAILDRGFDVTGRQLSGEFRNTPFQEQIDTVYNDLKEHFWHEDARVVCNSFGAYIFLHAQAQLAKPYIGKVLLLSPIVGEFENQDTQMNFIPPRANVLMELAQSGSYPTPKQCEIHTGSEDWQSNPDNVTKFGALVGINVTVVPDGGHNLPHSYVGAVLDNWLSDIT
jgi:predicted alpha/beta hydrolase family esterase